MSTYIHYESVSFQVNKNIEYIQKQPKEIEDLL